MYDRVVIYGAGQIGRKVLAALEKVNMSDKIVCFAVSDTQNAPSMINGIPLMSIDEIPEEYESAMFLISVSDRFVYEMEQTVIHKKIRHFIDGRKIYQADSSEDQEQKHIEVNIRELFMQQYKNGSFNRLDIVVRYLAIEDYHGVNDYGFALYQKMQSQRISEDYVEGAVKKFRELIESWECNGYDRTSEIECGDNLHLIDGSHRVAMGLYYNVDRLSCKVNPYIDDIEYGLEWFIEHGFSKEEIIQIIKKFHTICMETNRTISCVLWPAVYEYYDEITEKLGLLYEVKNVNDYCFKEETFERAVKGVYNVDDIEAWKIDKKIEHLREFPSKVIRILELNIPQPNFRLKKANNHMLLVEGERLKRIVRNCYSSKVENYFYDIIIHTGDNYEQSEYILNLFKQIFSLRDYFKEIEQYRWIAVKTDTPAMPDDFPETYPFSKDIDIICLDKDYNSIIDRTETFLNKVTDRIHEVNVIVGKDKTQIRLEQRGYLIFLFDIAVRLPDMEERFIEQSIERRKYLNGYYVAEEQDELIYRLYEYLMHSSKKHHIDYIRNNKQFWDQEKAIKAIPALREKILQINQEIFGEGMITGRQTK